MWLAWLAAGASRARLGPRFAVLATVLLLVALGAAVAAGSGGVDQPVAFNHRKHTQDLQLGCEFCHPYVRTGAHPGLPDLDTCAPCHQAVQGTSPEAARLTAYVEQRRPLAFAKLFRLPPHVFYTHRRHVGIAELTCDNCHGVIAVSTRPPRRPLVRIRMGFCLDCHRRTGQTLDCVACHR